MAHSFPSRSFLSDLYVEGVDSIRGAEYAAYKLFRKIEEHHGRAGARRIFALWGSPPSAKKLRWIKNAALLDRLDMMKPEPNVQRLARELAEENKTLPREERHGPRGSINPVTLDKYIRRLCDKRAKR
jgi:hypothetical protein